MFPKDIWRRQWTPRMYWIQRWYKTKEEKISPKASLVAIILFWSIGSEVEEAGGDSFGMLTKKEQYTCC